jgi:hypothetical protein
VTWRIEEPHRGDWTPVGAPTRTRRAAIVRYMVALDPALAGAPSVFVVAHWDKWRRQGFARVAKAAMGWPEPKR